MNQRKVRSMGTYRTLYPMKQYNDLMNYLKGKKKLDKYICYNKSLNFDYLDGKIGYPTNYNLLTVILGEKPIVQLSVYDETKETGTDNEIFEEIENVVFDNMITIFTKQGTIIEIVSTKAIERQFEGMIKFKE